MDLHQLFHGSSGWQASFQAPEGNDPVVCCEDVWHKEGYGLDKWEKHWLLLDVVPLSTWSTNTIRHIPRSFIKPLKNLIVVFEEEPGALIENIEIMTVNRDAICSYIEEFYPPDVKSWARKGS
ncbi:hypothetical protein ACFE04_015215 [Oxalis oulophora]